MSQSYAIYRNDEVIAIYSHDGAGQTAARSNMATLVAADRDAAAAANPSMTFTIQNMNADLTGVRGESSVAKANSKLGATCIDQNDYSVYEVKVLTNA